VTSAFPSLSSDFGRVAGLSPRAAPELSAASVIHNKPPPFATFRNEQIKPPSDRFCRQTHRSDEKRSSPTRAALNTSSRPAPASCPPHQRAATQRILGLTGSTHKTDAASKYTDICPISCRPCIQVISNTWSYSNMYPLMQFIGRPAIGYKRYEYGGLGRCMRHTANPFRNIGGAVRGSVEA